MNMALEKDFFRQVMGRFATGVTIVTTRSQTRVAGLTVNSFTSVSLNPPLVLICVEERSQALPFFRESGIFAGNILTQEQEQLSNCFATSSEERYTYFCHANYRVAATGSPILEGCLGFIDAHMTAEYSGGDHMIFVGQVEVMGYDGQIIFMLGVSNAHCTLLAFADALLCASSNDHNERITICPSPLLYYCGRYHHLSHHDHYRHDCRVSTGAHSLLALELVNLK
jgi:flavin reductase (DIM6/NTAB) family NADH-FMN oxidoreductase RutF